MAEHTRLNEEFLADIRRALQEQRREVLERQQQHWQMREEMFAPDLMDSGDNSVRENSLDMAQNLAESEREQVQAIDAALARIDGGTYGICLRCGDEIDPERLRALPQTTLCMGCADLQSQERREFEHSAKL